MSGFEIPILLQESLSKIGDLKWFTQNPWKTRGSLAASHKWVWIAAQGHNCRIKGGIVLTKVFCSFSHFRDRIPQRPNRCVALLMICQRLLPGWKTQISNQAVYK